MGVYIKTALFRKGSKSKKTFFIEEDISKYNSDSKRVYIENITYSTNKLSTDFYNCNNHYSQNLLQKQNITKNIAKKYQNHDS